MVKKKHVRLWNRSILMSEIGVRPKLRCWAKMSRKQTRKIGHQQIQILSSLLMSELGVRLCNRSILMSELGVRPKLRFWAKMSMKRTQKNRTSTNSASQITNPLEMVKKHFRLLTRSILRSELGVSPKLQCWAKMRRKQTRKIGHQRIQLLNSRTPKKW